MLIDIVKGIVASQDDFNLAGEMIGQDGLLQAATDAQADVTIVGPLVAAGSDNFRDLLYGRPQMTIVAISSDGREAILHQLKPHVIPLGEVSPASLIAAIRSASNPDGANAGYRVEDDE
jgi:hypothetical protein